MNARLISLVAIVSMLSAAGGCGAARNVLFGGGAACGACASAAPAYNVVPPTYGTPGYGTPGYGVPGYGNPAAGCGAPQCGVPYGGDCGCGGHADGSYYGGYGEAAYPSGTSIGSPMVGNGIYGGYPNNSYIPENSGWVPADPNMVPGSATVYDGAPAGPMAPIPRQ